MLMVVELSVNIPSVVRLSVVAPQKRKGLKIPDQLQKNVIETFKLSLAQDDGKKLFKSFKLISC
jgi:hypothetical protein